MDRFAERLAAQARHDALELEFVRGSEARFGTVNMPRLDVSAGPNRLTLWPDDEELVWARASVMSASAGGRVDTDEVDTYVDDVTIRLFVMLLKGEGRVIHRWLRRDMYEVSHGKVSRWLPVAGRTTVLERILYWPAKLDRDWDSG